MGITRAQIARQLLAEGGMPMKEIKGQNHMLAYITPNEADKLVRLGGRETMTPEGIPAYPEYDNYGYSSQQDFDQGNYGASSDPTVSGYDNKNLSDEDLKALSYAVKPSPKRSFRDKVIDSIKQIGQYTPFGLVKRGLGSLFDRFKNLRGGLTQKQFEDARRERQRQSRIASIMGRKAPFTAMTLENLRNLGYTGPLDDSLIGSTNITRSGTADDFYPDRVDGIVSQAPTNFRDAMANLNLQRGGPKNQQFLSVKDFIDPSKTISSEDLGTVESRISEVTGVPMEDIELARNYTKQDLEKVGAGTGIFGTNDQLDALQEYYDAVQGLSGPGSKFAPNNPAKAREFITKQSDMPFGMGSYSIDMDLVPKDFLETQQDLQQQKSPFELFEI
jgi:hypothetical protein